MSELNELKQIIKENLEQRGIIEKIKTEVKSEIFSIISEDPTINNHSTSKLSNENLLLNDLIREYLEFNRYNFTSNVLLAESGQPQTIMNRKFICDQLNIRESINSQSIPLLYSLINYFTQRTDTKYLPMLINKVNESNRNNNAKEDLSYLKVDSDLSHKSESSNGMPIVFSARDYLRDRSSYSGSSSSKLG